MTNTLTILLGFGGSGAKTIVELAELLTSDPSAARLAKERIHVILCDTDERDLLDQSELIEKQFADRCPGLNMQVEKFSLASNVDVFCDLVESRIPTTEKNADAVRRIREHWWFDEMGIPFSAPGMPLSVNGGAGQCPLVSHFLAWDKLSEFPEVLKKIDDYARNVRNMENYAVDLIMVGSLAGGTGRGCWQLVSFKAREHFGKLGQACRPYGFFYDQSIFEDVQRGRPEQAVKFQINSLTGLSELAMWLRSNHRTEKDTLSNPKEPRERRFSLPNLRSAENSDTDTLDTENYMPEDQRARIGRSPIHKAYLFTNESSSIKLTSAKDAYKVCAAALYGRMMVAQMRSADANQPARAAATATSVLFVPITGVRQVIVIKAKGERARGLLEGRTQRGDALVSVVSKSEVEVKDDDCRTRIASLAEATRKLFSPVRQYDAISADDAQRSLHAHFLQARETQSKDDLDGFAESFKSGDAEVFEESFKSYCATKPGDVSNRFLKQIREFVKPSAEIAHELAEAVAKSKSQAPILARVLLQRFVLERSDNFSLLNLAGKVGGCVGLGHAAISRVLEEVSKIESQIDKATLTAQASGSDALHANAVSLFKSASGNWLRSAPARLVLRTNPLSASTEMNLKELAKQGKDSSESVFVLRELKAIISEVQKILRAWLENSEDIVNLLLNCARQADKDSSQSVGEYFTRTDGSKGTRLRAERVLADLEKEDKDPMKRVLRRLRPIYSEEGITRLVQSTMNDASGASAVSELFSESLLKCTPTGSGAEGSIFYCGARTAAQRQSFRATANESLRQIIARQSTPDDALREFAFDAVLMSLMELWCELYNSHIGDEGYCQRLSAAVQNLTGISLNELALEVEQRGENVATGDTVRPPRMEDLMAATALQLGKKCDPLIRLPISNQGNGDLVTILLPDTSFGKSASEWEFWRKAIDQTWHLHSTDFRFVHSGLNQGNPFMLIANSDHPKGDFNEEMPDGQLKGWTGWSSFDYWRNPRLTWWLDAVEDPSGSSVFKLDLDDSIGLGYVDPVYVRNAHWSSKRWRPWWKPSRQRTQDRRNWEALAYALLGSIDYSAKVASGATSRPRYREFIEAFMRTVVPNPTDAPKELWAFPLLEERSGGDGPQFKRRLFVNTNNGIRQTGPEFQMLLKGKSMRAFVKWFKSDESRAALEAVWKEQTVFGKLIETNKDLLHDVLSADHRREIRLSLSEFVRHWKEHVATEVTRLDDREEQVQFLQDFYQVLEDPTFDVLTSFDSVAMDD